MQLTLKRLQKFHRSLEARLDKLIYVLEQILEEIRVKKL